MRPLYAEAQPKLGNTAHSGLWHDKFCDQWNEAFDSLGESGKSNWVKTFSGKSVGNAEQIREAVERHVRLSHDPLCFKTDGPFVTGLGRPHPIANGFAWHPTLGTPYLPGSAVKGLVRAWADQWEETANEEDVARIFGTQDHKGTVVFLDAIPTGQPKLKADVMTPHYGAYYQGDSWPADWLSPTPIPFLVVASGQTLVFGLLGSTDDVERCKGWLNEALAWLGAGAKTAVGYGRLEPDETASNTWRAWLANDKQRALEQEALSGLSPVAQELVTQANTGQWKTDKDAFSRAWETWLERLETMPDPQALERFSSLVRHHYPGLLDNPDGARKPKQQAIAKRLLALLTAIS